MCRVAKHRVGVFKEKLNASRPYEYPTQQGEKMFDSHIQRFFLATEETTRIVIQQDNHYIPIKCQSRLWSRRGTKVNGSDHGESHYSNQQGSKSRQKLCDSTSNGTDE